MSLNNLIIKLGAMGDVVRTTPLLRILGKDTYWVTKKESMPLLPDNSRFIKGIIDIDKAEESLFKINFNLVLSLDDDFRGARLAAILNKNKIIGSFLDSEGKLKYTDSAVEWFDMGLISNLGKEKADELKKNNTRTYQEIIFQMMGREFKDEEYILNFKKQNNYEKRRKILVGIEGRADKRWPTKNWNGYEQLGELLAQDGFDVEFFRQRDTIRQYINDISECELVITGDTLALHIALALRIKVVAIFTCTSPTEIHDYGRMVKIVSPLWKEAFYSREYIREAVDAVSLDSVYKAVVSLNQKGPVGVSA